MKALTFLKPKKGWNISLVYQENKLEYEVWNRESQEMLFWENIYPVSEEQARLTAIDFCKFYGIKRDYFLVNAIRKYHKTGVMEVYKLF